MGIDGGGPGPLPLVVELEHPEDSDRESNPTRVRPVATIQPDDPAIYVWGRRIQADMFVVEIHPKSHYPFRRPVGSTTYRRWEKEVGQPD